MAVDQEMEAVFKSVRSGDEVPDNTIGVDPESGNPVPAGSLPEEVRDDIPAQLSEGEYVVPADVLRYYGVKFFEDLRSEAKYAYQDMNENGRIGGEPIGMEMVEPEDDLDIMFDISDLEVIETPDEPEDEIEEAFLGKLFGKKEDGEDEETSKKEALDKLDALLDKSIKKRNAKKDAAKDMRSRDPSEGPSIAEQINFGGNYSDKDKPKKKKAEKLERKTYRASPSEVREQRRNEQGVNLLENKPDVWGNLGKAFGFAEGGDTSTYDNMGGFGDLSGGFDTTAYAEGLGQVEMRAYQNDTGRKIMITFIDGEPQMDIPEGYYPVGTEAVAIEPEDTAVQSQGDGGGGGGSPVPAPEPINYQGLTIAEMEDMLKEQQGMTGSLITAGAGIINPILGMAVKFGLSQNAKQLEAEMERRIKSGTLTDAERAKMEDMLAQAQEDKPSFLERLYGKLTGKDGEDYEGVQKDAVDAAVKEALGYQPVDESQSDIKGPNQVPIKTEPLDPTNNEPDNTKAGDVEGGYKARTAQQTQDGYKGYGSEKGNTAGQGDSSTPMTDAFGSGNTFTNRPSGSTSRSSGSTSRSSGSSDGNRDFERQMREDAARRSSAAQAGVSAVQSQMASSGQSAAQVGRTNAPSTARTSNTGSGSGGTATRNDSVSATDASDPRNRNKGGLMNKKKKK